MNKNFPKPVLHTVGVIAMAIFVFATWVLPYQAMQRCIEAGGAYAQSLAQCDSELSHVPPSKLVGLVFIRLIDGKRVSYIQQADLPNVGMLDGYRFSIEIQEQGQRYRMVMRGQTTTGEFQIERGYDNDVNAEIFVLKPTQPDAQPLRFLRRPQGVNSQLVQIGPDGKPLQTEGH
jgi:hypothetical protein